MNFQPKHEIEVGIRNRLKTCRAQVPYHFHMKVKYKYEETVWTESVPVKRKPGRPFERHRSNPLWFNGNESSATKAVIIKMQIGFRYLPITTESNHIHKKTLPGLQLNNNHLVPGCETHAHTQVCLKRALLGTVSHARVSSKMGHHIDVEHALHEVPQEMLCF